MVKENAIQGKVDYLLQQLQTKVLGVSARLDDSRKPGLHWGQFLVDGGDEPQVGVYGSSCAAIILNINRDDEAARAAVQNLMTYVNTGESELELAHNIKLALVCLALLPKEGAEASEIMRRQLEKLTARFQKAENSWPAFSVPNKFKNEAFKEPPAPVASAIIVIALCEILRRLSHQAHVDLQGMLRAILEKAAGSLENAVGMGRTLAQRHGSLLATAIILVKGARASSPAKSLFNEAVQERDFADRRVFFYDCLRNDGSVHRDYFILPAAVLLPLVADNTTLAAMQQARALDVGQALFAKIEDDGLFRGGQDLPSTVEQGLVALALGSTARAVKQSKLNVHVAKTWLFLTQPSPTGRPTKSVVAFVVFFWLLVIGIVGGKYVEEAWTTFPILGHILQWSSWLALNVPRPVADLLVFIAAVWPPSRSTFLRLINRNGRENL